MDYEKFIRERITELRLQANVSEYQLSHELGHAHGYINSITTGKMLPAMKEFLSLCEYFGITPKDFFDPMQKHPELVQQVCSTIQSMEESDLTALLHIAEKMKHS